MDKSTLEKKALKIAVKAGDEYMAALRCDSAPAEVYIEAYIKVIKSCPLMFLRDLDGTGSLHPCAKHDAGAIAVYALEESNE